MHLLSVIALTSLPRFTYMSTASMSIMRRSVFGCSAWNASFAFSSSAAHVVIATASPAATAEASTFSRGTLICAI